MSHTGLHIGGRLAGKLKGKHIITEQTAYGVLAIIACSHLLNDMLQSVVPAVYPILKESYGLSFVQIGIITFLLQLTSSIIQPFVGLYADHALTRWHGACASRWWDWCNWPGQPLLQASWWLCAA